jgi:micrococcal nuclease
MPLPVIVCEAPQVIDGDSIRCANIGQVRLLGIDAPDYRESRPCREGFGDHVCDDDGARAARESLRWALRFGSVRVQPVTRDRYRRLIATVSAGGRDLSCWQLRQRTARYIVKYDNSGRIRSACPALTR